MKNVITTGLIATFLMMGSSHALQAKSAHGHTTKPSSKPKVEEKLPEQLAVSITKSIDKKKKTQITKASVKIPFAKVGRRGKGNVEMVVEDAGKGLRIAKMSNLKKGTRLHSKLKSFLTKALADYKQNQQPR